MIRTLETFDVRIYSLYLPRLRHHSPAARTDDRSAAQRHGAAAVAGDRSADLRPGNRSPAEPGRSQGERRIPGGPPRPDRLDRGGPPPQTGTELRRMAFLYDGHVLVGQLRVPRASRSSDFLETAATFQTLFEVELYPWQAPPGRFLLLGRDISFSVRGGCAPGRGRSGRDPRGAPAVSLRNGQSAACYGCAGSPGFAGTRDPFRGLELNPETGAGLPSGPDPMC